MAGPREDPPEGAESAADFKVPSMPSKKKRARAYLSGNLTSSAEDELAWLNSAGTDATGDTAPAAADKLIKPQLNNEESSLIEKLLGKKTEDDLDDSAQRYFGQDVKANRKDEEKKEPEDVTAELVYDDEADELESFLQSKKKHQPAASSSSSLPSPFAPLAPPPPPAKVTAAAATTAAPTSEKPKDTKEKKAKSSFKF